MVKTKRSFVQRLIRFFERGLFAPFLLAIQPVLRLFLINDAEVYFSESLRSLFFSFLFGAIVFGLTYFLLRDRLKASTVASLFILLFFLFGDLSDWITAMLGLGPLRGNLLTLTLVIACMILWVWLVQKRIRNLASINLYFSLLSILFLLESGIPVAAHLLTSSISPGQDSAAPVAVVKSANPRPDIYYIILDAYGRQDILQSLYDFDNSDFLEALQARGFYIAEGSTSNYVQTLLSMSSSLNMDYIQSLKEDGTSFEDRQDLIKFFEESKVREILAQNGYEMVAFDNDSSATVSNAEIYYKDDRFAHTVTGFESIVFDHTMARVLLYIPVFNELLIEMPYDVHRSQILSTFARLREIPALEGNYFVYAHVIAPHPPFVFDENGRALPQDDPFTAVDGNYYMRLKGHSRKDYVRGYRRQLQYVNKLVLETVDAILAKSKTPPIIIIQGDHGPGSRFSFGSLSKTLPGERFSILNAYYFPTQEYEALYPSISPVNSFRVVLDQFFAGNYPLLPDRHYYSSWGYPFDFTEVTDLSLSQ